MVRIYNFKGSVTALFIAAMMLVTSCDSFEYDLPEANSKEDLILPTSSFDAAVTDDYLTYTFANGSSSSTEYKWDFGDTSTDADVSTEIDGEYTYPGEGTYTITLTASDDNGIKDVSTVSIEVIEPEIPEAINPDVLNGDIESKYDDWKFTSFTDGTTTPFRDSGEGDSNDYTGNDSGGSTRCAKWEDSESAGPSVSSSTRYAYQAFTVTPNTDYVIEYSYAIKNDVDDIDGGDRVIIAVLNGWFDDGKDAVASTPITEVVGKTANGAKDFTIKTGVATSNATGKISIMMYAITNENAYIDNVKIYPAD